MATETGRPFPDYHSCALTTSVLFASNCCLFPHLHRKLHKSLTRSMEKKLYSSALLLLFTYLAGEMEQNNGK